MAVETAASKMIVGMFFQRVAVGPPNNSKMGRRASWVERILEPQSFQLTVMTLKDISLGTAWPTDRNTDSASPGGSWVWANLYRLYILIHVAKAARHFRIYQYLWSLAHFTQAHKLVVRQFNRRVNADTNGSQADIRWWAFQWDSSSKGQALCVH
jgi:hypothetical protein